MSKAKILQLGLVMLGVLFGIWLSFVFSGKIIIAQSFSVFGWSVHYYGLILALAVACAYWLAMKRFQLSELSQVQAERLLFIVLISGFISARLYHVLSDWNFYWQNPELVIAIWRGGLSIVGAIIGGMITIFALVNFYSGKKHVLKVLDWLAPSVVIGQVIGRFGNLVNYEAFGYNTNLPWKMFVPESFRPVDFVQYSFYHPVFLYEIFGNIIILVILIALNKKQLKPGLLFFYWLFLYNVLRFIVEHLRIDSTFLTSTIRLNALVSAVLVLTALGAIMVINSRTQSKENYD